MDLNQYKKKILNSVEKGSKAYEKLNKFSVLQLYRMKFEEIEKIINM